MLLMLADVPFDGNKVGIEAGGVRHIGGREPLVGDVGVCCGHVGNSIAALTESHRRALKERRCSMVHSTFQMTR